MTQSKENEKAKRPLQNDNRNAAHAKETKKKYHWFLLWGKRNLRPKQTAVTCLEYEEQAYKTGSRRWVTFALYINLLWPVGESNHNIDIKSLN